MCNTKYVLPPSGVHQSCGTVETCHCFREIIVNLVLAQYHTAITFITKCNEGTINPWMDLTSRMIVETNLEIVEQQNDLVRFFLICRYGLTGFEECSLVQFQGWRKREILVRSSSLPSCHPVGKQTLMLP